MTKERLFKPPELVVQNTFQKIDNGSKFSVLYALSDLSIYSALYLRSMEVIRLPFVEAYEINAEAIDGVTIGYLFELNSRRVTSAYNYFLISALKKGDLKEDLVKAKTPLVLRFKIKDIKLYTLGAEGVLATCGYNKILKQTLEL